MRPVVLAPNAGAGPVAPARADSALSARLLAELGLVVGLLLLAAAVRWPDYLTVPTFTDEAREVTRAALIAQGRLQTLTNVDAYISSLYNYALAAVLIAFGHQLYLPRLFVLVVGSLTVPAAYALGRELGGRRAGLLAAALLATNPVHVLVNSHIAWSSCTAPLFGTLALWQTARAVERRAGAALLWAGLLFGLALLLHPSTLLLLPAALAYLLWRGRPLLRTRWPWLGAAAFLLVYGPLIAFNLATGFGSVRAVAEAGSLDPASRGAPSLGEYAGQVGRYALLTLRVASGAIDQRPRPEAFLQDPGVLIWGVLGLIAPLSLARRGQPLPMLVLLSSLGLAALYPANTFEPIPNGRYVMASVVACYAGLGAALFGAAPAARDQRRLGRWAGPAVAFGLVVLTLRPLGSLAAFDEQRPTDNRALLSAIQALDAARRPGEPVLVDERLAARRAGLNVRLVGLVVMLLEIRATPFELVPLESTAVEAALAPRGSLIAVVDHESLPALRERFDLTPLAAITPPPPRGERRRDWQRWRDLVPIGADPNGLRRRAGESSCDDCVEHAVVRIGPRG